MTPRPRLLIAILQGVVYLAMFVLTLEACARLDDWIRWGAPILEAYSFDSLWLEGRGAPRNRPHASYQQFRINNHGFRGADFPLEKPRGLIRVALVGASETFGLYESPGKDLTSQVQQKLDSLAPRRFHVINAAAVGMTPPRVRELFHQWLRRFEIDVIVFYPTPAFYVDQLPPREVNLAPVSQPPRPVPQIWYAPRITSKAWTLLREHLPASLQVRMKEYLIERERRAHREGPWTAAPPDRVSLFERHLTELVTDIQHSGTTIMVATHATRFRDDWRETDRDMIIGWVKFFSRATPECLLDMEEKANDIVRAVGARLDVPVIDLANLVEKRPENFADFAHFTDHGAEAAGSIIAARVLRVAPDPEVHPADVAGGGQESTPP